MSIRQHGDPNPAPCDPEIYSKGELVAVLEADAPIHAVESWVRRVANSARVRLDWYTEGGYPQVLHLGDDTTYRRAISIIKELDGQQGVIVRRVLPRGHISAFRRDR